MKFSKTALILFGICALSFVIKTFPFSITGAEWSANMPDSLYTLRLVELFDVFGYHPEVDYYTTFPEGAPITWGIVFTFLCWCFWKLSILPFLPPLLFCGVIIAVYFIGKELVNSKVGLISALIIALVNGRLFYSALFGGIDHHIGEIFFSTLFILFFILTIKRENYLFLIPTIISGALMCYVMPQVMIFPIIICLAVLIGYFFKNHNFKHLALSGSGALLGMYVVLLPFTNFNYTFSDTACGSPLITFSCLIGALGCYALFWFKHFNISKWIVLGLTIGGGVLAGIFLSQYSNFMWYLEQFIPYQFSFIGETNPYNVGLFVMSLGLLVVFVIYGLYKFKKLSCLPLMISWLSLITLMTLAHGRWEYLFMIPVCIIAAVGVYELIRGTSNRAFVFKVIFLIGIVLLILSGFGFSYASADNTLEDKWTNIGDWLQENTPEQDYYNNTPPDYGILTFWEYGHYVEVWGHRATYSNPFQAHIESEKMLYTGENIPENIKYIIIPDEMLNSNKYYTDAVFTGLGLDYPKENTFMYKLYNSGKELYEYKGIKIFSNPF